MKYLSDYCEEGAKILMDQYGGFYAFSDKQFNEKKKDGVEYVNCGYGLICPKEHAKALMQGLIENGDKAVKQDLAENGREGVIRRELYNHEAFYTGSIEQTWEAILVYGFSRSEVWKVFYDERPIANAAG